MIDFKKIINKTINFSKAAYIRIKAFAESEFFILLVSFVAFFSFVTELDFLGFSILVAMYMFIMFSDIDIKAGIPIIISMVFCVARKNHPLLGSEYYFSIPVIVGIVILGFLFAVSMIYGVIKRGLKVKKSFNFWGVAGICVAFIFGGIFAPGYNALSIVAGIIISAYFFVPFCYFSATLKKSDFSYLAKSVLAASIVIVLQLFYLHIVILAELETFEKGLIILGWGISNSIAIMIVVGMPFAIYFMAKSRFASLYFVLLALQLLAAVFTFSRGALIIAVPIVVAGWVYSLFAAKKWQRIQLGVLGAVIIMIIGLYIFLNWEAFVLAMDFYIKTGLDNRGRIDLLELALERFVISPAFGMGIFDIPAESSGYLIFTWYHNTFMQFMAWGGIFGLVLYILHLTAIGSLFIKRISFERIIAALAIAIIFVHSLIDCVIFFPTLTIMYMGFIAFSEVDYYDSAALLKNPEPKTILS